MTLGAALREATHLLERGGIEPARLTAEVLLAHAVGCTRAYLYAHPERELNRIEWIHFGRYLHERLQGKPTQYITGRQEFYGREFRVTPAVLIPRPETEHVVEAALEASRPPGAVVDVGTGSGAIAVTLALEMSCAVVATELSWAALEVARENARRLGAPVRFIQCDLVAALANASASLVVSNPPYVPESEIGSLQREVRDWEPRLAFSGGEAGLDCYARLIGEAARVLRPGGWLVVELGAGQAEAVREMLGRGWSQVRFLEDLAGRVRVAAAQREATG